MIKFLKNQKVKTIVLSSILIIFGLLFCVLPNSSINYLEIVLSTLFIVYGIICLLGFTCSPRELREPLLLLESIIFMVVGVLIDFFPSLFVIAIGIIITVGGIKEILNAINIKFIGEKNWWINVVIGIIFAALGLTIIILSGTNVASMIVSIFLGVTLILDGICYLLLLFAFKREIDKIKREADRKMAEIFGKNNEGEED